MMVARVKAAAILLEVSNYHKGGGARRGKDYMFFPLSYSLSMRSWVQIQKQGKISIFVMFPMFL